LKITFLAASQNQSRCGITDYIELLCQELNKRKTKCEYYGLNQKDTPFNKANNFPEADIFSIQFAPYAFSSSGLFGSSLIDLAVLLSNKKLHINFHEIWIGAYPRAPLKERFIGWKQKREILRFIDIAKPNYITCSNAATIDRMISSGIDVNYLYLFGNIPYTPYEKKMSSEFIKVVAFGTLYKNFPYEILGKILNELAKSLKLPIELKIFGRQRDFIGLKRIKSISENYGFSIIECGELPVKSISHELQLCDIGISTTPYDIIGKSGATAAMLEHRLPVLAYDDGDTPQESLFIPEPFKDQIFLINDHSSVEKLLQYIEKPRKSFFDGVAHTANKMLDLVS
jgi:hypothetical protein